MRSDFSSNSVGHPGREKVEETTQMPWLPVGFDSTIIRDKTVNSPFSTRLRHSHHYNKKLASIRHAERKSPVEKCSIGNRQFPMGKTTAQETACLMGPKSRILEIWNRAIFGFQEKIPSYGLEIGPFSRIWFSREIGLS